MKNFVLLTLGLVLSSQTLGSQALAAEYRTIALTSSEGVKILLKYTAEAATPNSSGGTTHTAVDARLLVLNADETPVSQGRAVVINKCTNEGTGEQHTDVVELDLQIADPSFADTLSAVVPDVVFSESNYRYRTVCKQEIAVVLDGTWLTDPVNRTHNFKFAFLN